MSTLRVKKEVPLPRMHAAARGSDHEKEETLPYLRLMWDSVIRSGTSRHIGLPATSRPRRS